MRMTAVQRAIRDWERNPRPREAGPIRSETGAFSHFLLEVHDRKGRLKFVRNRHNLTTDTASGYTNRRDWQAKAMGGGLAPTATMSGNATATTATTLTNSGASFPTTNQGLAGRIVACGPNSSGTGSIVFGVIVSNTGTALTVDQWTSAGTYAAGTTPNATCSYQVLPGQAPANYLGVTSSSTAPTSADTTLASEATTSGFSRTLATWAHTAAASTYTLQVVWTASGTLTLNNEAVFGAANPTAGGVMPFVNTFTAPPPCLSGDTVTETVTVTIN